MDDGENRQKEADSREQGQRGESGKGMESRQMRAEMGERERCREGGQGRQGGRC